MKLINNLSSSSQHADLKYPTLESQWLVSRAWNTGVMRFRYIDFILRFCKSVTTAITIAITIAITSTHHRSRDLNGAELWMGKALQLLDMLMTPEESEKQRAQMNRSYQHVLKQLRRETKHKHKHKHGNKSSRSIQDVSSRSQHEDTHMTTTTAVTNGWDSTYITLIGHLMVLLCAVHRANTIVMTAQLEDKNSRVA